MALTPIQAVRLFIGDNSEPYTFTDEEIQYFLDMAGGSVRQASIFAIYAILADLAKNKSVYRETAGHYEVWSNALDWYKLLLSNITQNPTLGLGSLNIYAAGIDTVDVWNNRADCGSYSGKIVKTIDEVDCKEGHWMDRFAYGIPDLPYWVVRR
jgi:hypothetical protein